MTHSAETERARQRVINELGYAAKISVDALVATMQPAETIAGLPIVRDPAVPMGEAWIMSDGVRVITLDLIHGSYTLHTPPMEPK